MAENKNNNEKIKELKIEMLKQNIKKKKIRKQIAKILTEEKTKLGEKKEK